MEIRLWGVVSTYASELSVAQAAADTLQKVLATRPEGRVEWTQDDPAGGQVSWECPCNVGDGGPCEHVHAFPWVRGVALRSSLQAKFEDSRRGKFLENRLMAANCSLAK
ncbi:MAG: hypothetical protein A2940_01190 [Candidatus Wildermuthbacteria bacterium RIFCSPLOWO2_01_FULL_48_29]|uniref:SWIM-type domain-containing protein n=1 Tax=Candidatus Wildermuthbacteria bacterium RIFCSPLOWO2_01_FULL_48_29 TaxID=1802462 RepID=A0A1G2RKF5_9BACT|nr:MAG: hypothetical protein A2940_01190 [Candidatus Wildermuthbacteria bacterium RIFCSPLOWO2_01_FULL_48_29]